jgi:hypothetical protein
MNADERGLIVSGELAASRMDGVLVASTTVTESQPADPRSSAFICGSGD